jgi:hypothetical protein
MTTSVPGRQQLVDDIAFHVAHDFSGDKRF